MKKTSRKILVIVGILALVGMPAMIHAVDSGQQSGQPCGPPGGPPGGPPCGPPPVPPFFAEKFSASHSGVLTPEEQKAAWEAFLMTYDKDHDGRLSPDELKAVHADEGKAFFEKADANHDGTLSQEEFDAAWASFHMMPPGPGKPHHKGWFSGWFSGRGDRPCDK